MPTQIKKLPGPADGYEVSNPESGAIHSKKTSKAKAKAQARILDAVAKAEAPVAKAEPAVEMKAEGKGSSHKWIMHIKKFASDKGITYSQALKHADLKKDYTPVVKAPRSPRVKKEKVMVAEGVINQIPDQAVLAIAANAKQMGPNELGPELESLASAKKVRKPRSKKTAAV